MKTNRIRLGKSFTNASITTNRTEERMQIHENIQLATDERAKLVIHIHEDTYCAPTYSVSVERHPAFKGTILENVGLVSSTAFIRVKVQRPDSRLWSWAQVNNYDKLLRRLLTELLKADYHINGIHHRLSYSWDNASKEGEAVLTDVDSVRGVQRRHTSAESLTTYGGVLGGTVRRFAFVKATKVIYATTYDDLAEQLIERGVSHFRVMKVLREVLHKDLPEGQHYTTKHDLSRCQFRAYTAQGDVKGMLYRNPVLVPLLREANVDLVINTEGIKVARHTSPLCVTIGIKAEAPKVNVGKSYLSYSLILFLAACGQLAAAAAEAKEAASFNPIKAACQLCAGNEQQMEALKSLVDEMPRHFVKNEDGEHEAMLTTFTDALPLADLMGTVQMDAIWQPLMKIFQPIYAQHMMSFGIMADSIRGIVDDFRMLDVDPETGLPQVYIPGIGDGEILGGDRQPFTGPEAVTKVVNRVQTDAHGKPLSYPLMSQKAGKEMNGDFDGDYYQFINNGAVIDAIDMLTKWETWSISDPTSPIRKSGNKHITLLGDDQLENDDTVAKLLTKTILGDNGLPISMGEISWMSSLCMRQIAELKEEKELCEPERKMEIDKEIQRLKYQQKWIWIIMEATLKSLKHVLEYDNVEVVEKVKELRAEFPVNERPSYFNRPTMDQLHTLVFEEPSDVIERHINNCNLFMMGNNPIMDGVSFWDMKFSVQDEYFQPLRDIDTCVDVRDLMEDAEFMGVFAANPNEGAKTILNVTNGIGRAVGDWAGRREALLEENIDEDSIKAILNNHWENVALPEMHKLYWVKCCTATQRQYVMKSIVQRGFSSTTGGRGTLGLQIDRAMFYQVVGEAMGRSFTYNWEFANASFAAYNIRLIEKLSAELALVA